MAFLLGGYLKPRLAWNIALKQVQPSPNTIFRPHGRRCEGENEIRLRFHDLSS